MTHSQTIWQDLSAVREKAPLIHNITNFVVMNVTANALLALVAPAAAQFQILTTQNGTLQISFTGDAFWNYTVEVSTNLTTWSALTNLTSVSGQFNFSADFNFATPQQFFRARVGP